MSLNKKLTLSFIFAILVAILIISFISNKMINDRFDTYLIDERNKKFETIREDINELFLQKGSSITSDDISNYAKMEGIYIEIKDLNNTMICNANNNTPHHRKMMNNMMKGHGKMMNSYLKNTSGAYRKKAFPLIQDEKQIATLIIGYFDNAHLTESALIFKNTLAKSFILSGMITTVLGLLISIFLSKGLTNPLISITETANLMRNGNLNARTNAPTSTKEIMELSDSINYLAETLEKQELLRKRYASDISHELRTPLTTLKSHVEAIMDGVWEPSYEHLNILMEEIDNMTKLVDDLRNTFQIFEGKLSINKTLFDISEEMKNIIFLFTPIFEKEGFSLEYSIEDNIQISMDKDRLKQIMYNLLSNSMKYLYEDGKVKVKLCKEDKHIKIIVEDNGSGIKEEDIPHIFERFYRTDVSRDRKTGGTGLGLSITKTLVEAHGGSIHVESKFGIGTIFTILIPSSM